MGGTFGGGSGATVSINPIAFLIVENGKVRLLPVNHTSCLDKILDYVPDLFERIGKTACKLKEECNYQGQEIKEENREDRYGRTQGTVYTSQQPYVVYRLRARCYGYGIQKS